jgi:hypothetical protein
MRNILGWGLALLLCCPSARAAEDAAKSLDKGVAHVVKDLWPQLRNLKGKICVLDFIRPAGTETRRTEFGQLLAEKISSQLVKRRNEDGKARFEVGDRLHLVRIMDDLGLWGADEDQKMDKLRESAAADYLVTGVYSLLDEKVTVTAKLLDVQGKLLASGEFTMTAGADFDRLEDPAKEPAEDKPGKGLDVDAALVYVGSDRKLRMVHPGMTLTSEHLYGVYLRPVEDCFAYVFQVDSTGQVQMIFPNSDFHTGGNRLDAGEDRWVPNDQELYQLDEHQGTETIYVAASRQPLRELEEMAGKTSEKGDMSGSKDQLLDRFHSVGLMGARSVKSVAVQRLRPLKDKPADFLLNRVAADAAHKGFYWAISFEHR